MSNSKPLGWLDVHLLGEHLAAAYPDVDPLRLRFTELRSRVEALAGFTPDPAHPVNEKILEAIQMAWHDEREDQAADVDADDED